MKAHQIAFAVILLLIPSAYAQSDPADGEQVFKRCQACHAIGEGAKNRVGPELNGIVGRPAASVESFKYSPAMVEAGVGGLVWTEDELRAFLQAPKEKVPGTKMGFGGIKNPKDLQNLTAYLAIFAADGTAAPQ